MSEQERDKAGLHKEISSIFKGVPIPQTDGGQEPSGTPAPERSSYTEPKQPTPEPQQPCDAPVQERTGYVEPKPPTPEPQQPCDAPVQERTSYTEPKQPTPEPQQPKAPKPSQATQSLPKGAPEHTGDTEPKQPAPDFGELSRVEPQKPKAPKPYQAMQSLPKSTGAQQPKADIDDIEKKVSQKRTTVKISRQTFRQQITNKLFTPKPGVSATKQKAMVVTMPLLFIFLIFMLLKGGVFGTSVRKTEASAEDNVSSVATVGLNTKIDWKIPASYPTTLRDPMQLGPVATAQTETETETRTFVKLIVKGIVYTEDNPSAVIGSQIVHEGEEIQGVTIVKISKDSVEFEMDGKRWTQKVQ